MIRLDGAGSDKGNADRGSTGQQLLKQVKANRQTTVSLTEMMIGEGFGALQSLGVVDLQLGNALLQRFLRAQAGAEEALLSEDIGLAARVDIEHRTACQRSLYYRVGHDIDH